MINFLAGAQGSAARPANFTLGAPYIRYAAALVIAPIATTILVETAFFAYLGAPPSGAELSVVIRLGLMTGFFVEFLIFLPLFVVARRFLRMSFWLATLLGALSGWIAPVAYLLLMAVWRGEALNAWVINFSDNVLSPWLALFGALGGLIFWLTLLRAETAPQLARVPQRAASIARPAPVNGLSGS